jgi:hypothetical protein
MSARWLCAVPRREQLPRRHENDRYVFGQTSIAANPDLEHISDRGRNETYVEDVRARPTAVKGGAVTWSVVLARVRQVVLLAGLVFAALPVASALADTTVGQTGGSHGALRSDLFRLGRCSRIRTTLCPPGRQRLT